MPATAQAPADAPLASATPVATGQPPLQSVPPRPQLSYTVQQQRQIVQALVADRENARYTSQVIRYRSGLSSLPPPPTPPASAVAMPAAPAAETAPARPSLSEQETMVDFLAALRRFFAGDDEPEPAALPLPASPDAGADAAPEPQVGLAPTPPGQSAVAARMATTDPNVIDEILDATIAQAPLPPLLTADAARHETGQQVVDAAPAPLPAPRPATARLEQVLPSARPLAPAPPPLKPVVPVGSSAPPQADDDRSAGLAPPAQPGAGSLADSRSLVTPATPRS